MTLVDDDREFMFKCVVWVYAQTKLDAVNILEHLQSETVTFDVVDYADNGKIEEKV